MKEIILYLDVFPGMNDKYISAQTDPAPKVDFCTRYAITVKIPDPNKPDATLPVHEIKEVDKDELAETS